MGARKKPSAAKAATKPDAAASLPAAPPEVGPVRQVEADPPRRIRVVIPAPPTPPQTMMGRAIRPFAKPAQSGSFHPFAVGQARRGR